MSTADAIDDRAHMMVRQMVMPLVPERRVKGALEYVARDTGVSYSKLRKIFYRVRATIRAFEYHNIAAAMARAARNQERLYRMEADRLAALIAECERLERQYALTLSLDPRAAGKAQDETADRGR